MNTSIDQDKQMNRKQTFLGVSGTLVLIGLESAELNIFPTEG